MLDILKVDPPSSALPLPLLSVDQLHKLEALLLQAQSHTGKSPLSSRSYASLLSQPSLAPPSLAPPPSLPSTSWIDRKPSVQIRNAMISSSKESFTFAAIGRFEGKIPSLEWVEQHTHQIWKLPIRSLISLTDTGYFVRSRSHL